MEHFTINTIDQSGHKIAVEHIAGSEPGILFCGGFKSDMQGNKARFLDNLCRENGWQYTRFDYRGHGQSDADFGSCTLDDWIADSRSVLQKVTTGPQLLVGSSMGAWVAVHVAKSHQQRIVGLLGIASAPDFTERLIWQQLEHRVQQDLIAGGTYRLPSLSDSEQKYEISYPLIASGRRNSVLSNSFDLQCPIRLLHGTADLDVPYSLSVELLHALAVEDATLTLMHNVDHRFSSDTCLQLIARQLIELRDLYTKQ